MVKRHLMKINFRKFLNRWAKFGLGYSLFVALTLILIVSIPPLNDDFMYRLWGIMFFFLWFPYVLLGVVVLIIQIIIEILQKFQN
jgi:Ca2+/Na+ antiporter